MTAALRPQPVPSPRGEVPTSMIERLTLILDIFDRPGTRLTLEDLARRTGLPRSTTHRILEQLTQLDWIAHTHSGYGLGRRALGLGGRDLGCTRLRAAAAPYLQELSSATGMVAHLAILEGPDVYYLDKVGTCRAVEIPSQVGGRAPAHCTALGKAMGSRLAPEEISVRFGSALLRATTRTITDLDLLNQEIDRIRQRRGLAVERGECLASIACVAAPIPAGSEPLAAISLAGSIDAQLERVAPAVPLAARRIALALAGHRSAPRLPTATAG